MTVRTDYGETDWFRVAKGVRKTCILSPCLFNLYAEDFIWKSGLHDTQSGIKIGGRKLNNLRYADDTTLTVESADDLKAMIVKIKEESGLKLNVKKTKLMLMGIFKASGLVRKNKRWLKTLLSCDCIKSRWQLQPWNQKTATPGKKSNDEPWQVDEVQGQLFDNKNTNRLGSGLSCSDVRILQLDNQEKWSSKKLTPSNSGASRGFSAFPGWPEEQTNQF